MNSIILPIIGPSLTKLRSFEPPQMMITSFWVRLPEALFADSRRGLVHSQA